MIRWIGLALLSVSWLLGLSYYHLANWPAWLIVVFAGSAMLGGAVRRFTAGWAVAIAIVLLLPVLSLMPWPYRLAPLLMAAGLVLQLLPIPRRWPKLAGSTSVVAGTVLLAQSLAVLAYTHLTARSHELPWPLPHCLGLIATLLGIEASVDGSCVALWSMRQTHLLGATWELLLDPPSVCFLVGGVVLLALQSWAEVPCGERRTAFLRAVRALVLSVSLWLPVRAGGLMALYLHRVLRTDYDAPLNVMNQFWSPWLHFVLLAGPVLLAWRFARISGSARRLPQVAANRDDTATGRWRRPVGVVLAGLAVALLSVAVYWDPVGVRQGGRVLVDEHHTTWEPTEKPYDTAWYGSDSGYNYFCIYDYCSRFYEMSRLKSAVTPAILKDWDVFVVKVPTSPYTQSEIDAIRDFVRRGGGLLLIGEHTDVFHTGTNLNDIASVFGFTYRFDCLFGVDKVFDELYFLPPVPHPIIQHLPPFDFAVSCSIVPGSSSGRAVIVGTGLKNLPADYHASNFYPQVEDRPDMRYGAFIQLWATRYGAGRVVAFTDSTVFSNFSTFEPGKAELMLGMLEWLNHRGGAINPRYWLVPLGLVCLLGALLLARGWGDGWVLLLAAGLLGWTVAGYGVRAANRRAMPLPKQVRPMTLVVIDRTVCDVPLPKSGFIEGRNDRFGIFERWILRLGYFTSRRSGEEEMKGDMIVFFHPDLAVNDEFRNRLVRYVAEGGKVLVLDSPENASSTANSLLWPFGLTARRGTDQRGALAVPAGWAQVNVDSSLEVAGGRPFAYINGKPVAATVRYGKGTVTLLGFATRFADGNMGVTGDVVPNADLLRVYNLEFSLLRAIVEDRLP